ncbi:MAG: transposase [Rickettsia endosymbiont of Culicoides impunctatus]|nr:MAG: transposase [Rickettsia endosymbiont of Culicoides impunctatus]
MLKNSLSFFLFFCPKYWNHYNQARSRYGWIKKGKDKTLPTNIGWKRMHIVGAINIDNLHLVGATKPKINGKYIIEFLQKLEESIVKKEKIYLICDNAGYHKSKLVKEYLNVEVKI